MTELGTFFWYSIPQQHLSLERVRRAWRTAGLPVRFLPESRKPADVAAEACNAAVGRGLAIRLEQVANTAERLVYSGGVGEGSAGTELVFDKASGEFACADSRVLQRVRRIYEQNCSRLPSHKQRQAIRAALLQGGAENLHGSIYFMPANAPSLDTLQKVWHMVYALYGGEAEFHRIPVGDDPMQAAYLKAAIDRVLSDDMLELTSEVNVMLDTERPRKWRSDRIETIRQRRQALEARTQRWATLLHQAPVQASERAKAMSDAVDDLVGLSEAPVIV